MEDDAGPVLGEDLAHLDPVLDVGHDRHAGEEPALAGELAVDLEQRRLGVVDQHEPRRAEAGELAAELGADRAAGTGHHHDLRRDVPRDAVEIDLDRLAAEHVLDLDRAQLGREPGVAADELGQARQGLDGQAGSLRGADDPAAHLTGGGRHRDEHLVGAAVADHLRQVGGRADDADPVEAEVALARVVVDDRDRRVAEAGIPQHLLDHELRRIAGADDDRLLAAGDDLARQRPLDQRAREEARPRDEGEAEEQVDEPDARRERAPGWNSKSVKTRNVASEASATPRSADHMSRVETYRHQRL